LFEKNFKCEEDFNDFQVASVGLPRTKPEPHKAKAQAASAGDAKLKYLFL
jgi:hypothetical protein